MSADILAVQLPDTPTSDSSLIRCVTFSKHPPFGAASFVIVECPSGRLFFGSVSGPNRNLNRNSLAPHDNTQVNQLEGILAGKMARNVAINECYYYEVTLLKTITDETIGSVRLRPQTGARIRPATEDEIMKYLGMPPIDPRTQIGTIIDTDIPICVSPKILLHHLLVAGATGSGKSNTIANLAAAAVNIGWAVVILDHKPDYQNVHEPNDYRLQSGHFQALSASPAYWYIGEPMAMAERTEYQISVPALRLSRRILAATLFYLETETLQQEGFLTLLEKFVDEEENRQWTIRGDFLEWLNKQTADRVGLHEATFGAIRYKLKRRIPSWVESDYTAPSPRTPFDERRQSNNERRQSNNARNFDPETITSGSTTIIRIGGSSDRDYGLLLSYVIGRLHRKTAKERGCRVLVIIDEAQDIFSGSAALKAAVERNLNERIRKGRTLGIGYVIGVQASGEVPDQTMNNLNSRIIHGHGTIEQLRKASSRLSEAQRDLVLSLSAGEALVSFLHASSIIHCQMQLSPFKLTKDEDDL